MKNEQHDAISLKELTTAQIRANKEHDIAGNKVNSLLLDYLRNAKDDSLGAKYFFDKYNEEWKVFVGIKNKQQRDVKLNMNAFEKRVEYMMELAEKQLQEQNEEISE